MVKFKKAQERKKLWKQKKGAKWNKFKKFQNRNGAQLSDQSERPRKLTKKDVVLRKRGDFTVITPPEGSTIPSCEHGPCLLFGQKNGDESNWNYVCAIYRKDKCNFKKPYNEADMQEDEAATSQNGEAKKKIEYGAILKKLKTFPSSSKILYCAECMDVFADKHACVCAYVKRAELREPSRLLTALENPDGEAQYLFSREALDHLCLMCLSANVSGVLCIGAPRLYETLRKDMKNMDAFLLDYDKRYAPFVHSLRFAQYSMLTNHFYDKTAKKRFNKFLRKQSSLLVICDPPFGVFMEPLLQSVAKIRQKFTELHDDKPIRFYSCFVLPYFVGKHVLRQGDNFWMSDLKVTYENHKDYVKPEKSTVRLFTDLPKSAIQLSNCKDYRFCDMCEKYVATTNVHCFKCETCPSKDGSTYKHCNRCKRCFKSTYEHCAKCKKCHLPRRCYEINEEEEE